MAKIPLAQERVVFSGAQFRQAQTQDVSQPMVEVLNQWGNQRREEFERKTAERVASTAARQQQEAGLDSLAAPPDRWAAGYQEAFNNQAKAVFASNLTLDMNRTARELSREHGDDPAAFAESWNAYMVGTLEPLEESDPAAAQEAREALDTTGMQVQFKIEDALEDKAHKMAQASFLQDMDQQIVELQNALLHGGTEEDLAAYTEGIADLAMSGVEAGFLTGTQAASLTSEARTRGAEELAHGLFNKAIAAGDVGGARGVIQQAKAGVWFDDNPHGRRTAARLEKELKSMLSAGESARKESTVRAFRTVNSMLALQQATGESVMSRPELRESVEFIQIYGNENDQDRLQRALTGLFFREQLGGQFDTLSDQELEAAEAALAAAAPGLSSDDVSGITGLIADRRDELAEARQDLDPLRVGPPVALPENIRSDSDAAALFQELETRRGAVSRALGVSKDALGFWSKEDERAIQDRYQSQLAQGDIEAAMATQEMFFLPAQGDPARQIALAMSAEDPDFAAAMAANAVVGPEIGAQLWTKAIQGREADPGFQDVARDLLASNKVQRDLRAKARALSSGNPAVRDAVYNLLADAYTGVAVEQDAVSTRGVGGRTSSEFDKLTAPLRERYQFENGSSLPLVVIDANPARAKRIGKFIDNMLNAPEAFGFQPGDDLRSVHPVPTPDGNVVFASSSAPGTLIVDPESDPNNPMPLSLDPMVAVPPDERLDASWGERASNAINSAAGAMRIRDFRHTTLPRASAATGVELGTLDAVMQASQKTQTTSNSMALTPVALESLDKGEYERAWGKYTQQLGMAPQHVPRIAPDPLTNSEGAAVAAGMVLDKFAAKYGDAEQALAAYHLGEDVVDSMGEDWRSVIGAEAWQFIERVKQEANGG